MENLGEILRYDLGSRELEAVELFWVLRSQLPDAPTYDRNSDYHRAAVAPVKIPEMTGAV